MYVEGRIKNAGPFQNDPGCFINGQTYSLEVVRCKVGGHVLKYAVMVAHALQVHQQSLKCFSFTIGYRLHGMNLAHLIGVAREGSGGSSLPPFWIQSDLEERGKPGCATLSLLLMNLLPVYARAIFLLTLQDLEKKNC